MEQSPFGLGHVSIESSMRKSAKLNMKILVSSTITHLSILILTALTSDLQLVSIIHLRMAK